MEEISEIYTIPIKSKGSNFPFAFFMKELGVKPTSFTSNVLQKDGTYKKETLEVYF